MSISWNLDVDSTSLNVMETCIAFVHLFHVTGQICGYWETVVKNMISNENTAVRPEDTWLLPKVINGATCHFIFILSNDILDFKSTVLTNMIM